MRATISQSRYKDYERLAETSEMFVYVALIAVDGEAVGSSLGIPKWFLSVGG